MLPLSFENTAIAFKGKDDAALRRSYWLFKLIGNPTLVKIGGAMTHFAVGIGFPIGWLIKKNIFAQFCGGETVEECKVASARLAEYNIGTILDYSVEGKEKEADFDATADEIIRTIAAAKGDPHIPFCVFKVTGVARFELLEKQNEVVRGTLTQLSERDQSEWNRVVQRVLQICQAAYDADQRIFIDAEDSWIQDAIDALCHDMMEKFNHNAPIVYNTIQLYRHDRLDFLKKAHAWSREKGLHYAVKLVRGAYMEKEGKRAAEMGYQNPIQPSKEATDSDFNAGVQYCLDNLQDMALCCGSHNEESSMLLAQWMEEKGVVKNDNRVAFAQLFGMSDHISYNLADAGYNVVKYLPYGPIKEVMPYLLRRAQENTSVKGQTSRELGLILKERKRREGMKQR
jgi:proline dehydrogenase